MRCARIVAAARFIAVSSSPNLPSLDTCVPYPRRSGKEPPMSRTIKVAAAGDIHAGAADADRVRDAFRDVADEADLIVLAGDLTQHGQVDEVRVVADACRAIDVPVVAVLGNHDWQSDRPADLTAAPTEAGVIVLDRSHTIVPV